MNYYCLIAGLPDLQLDQAKNLPSMETLLEELQGTLSAADAAWLRLLQMQYDNRNLLAYLADKNAPLHPLGTLTAADWAELMVLIDETDNPKDARLQPYMLTFLQAVNDEKTRENIHSQEDFLATLYYDFGSKSENKFVADWFNYCLDINNILAALICRKHGLDVKQAIVGNNTVAKAIRKNNTRDFGLTGIFDDLDALMLLAEEPNLLERERKIDQLKWNWLEEQTFFKTFDIESVFAYLLKLEMIERWVSLDKETGEKTFREIVGAMKKGSENALEEFKRNNEK